MSFLKGSLTPIISIGSFSALPSAADGNPNAIYKVSGVGTGGFSYWRTSGAIWFPVNNELTLYEYNGNVNAPVATVSGTVTYPNIQAFTTPDVLNIPAGMLVAGSRIRIEAIIGSTDGIALNTLLQFGNATDGYANIGQINASNAFFGVVNYDFNMVSASTLGIGGTEQLNEGSTVTVPASWDVNLNCAIRDCEILIGAMGMSALRSYALYGLCITLIQ